VAADTPRKNPTTNGIERMGWVEPLPTSRCKFAVVEFLGPGNFGAFAVHVGVNVAPGAK